MESAAPMKLDHRKQVQLNQLKRETRINNEHYFRAHPELRAAMKVFMAEVLAQKPNDVRAFTQTFFADPTLPARLGVDGYKQPSAMALDTVLATSSVQQLEVGEA
mmetsp:Transcript_37662/g.121032  ORF Transcript_37662/g.121032 Transcript_37662/m.121032 type:complete len:105 (+) Transcript_37662:106-420(+)